MVFRATDCDAAITLINEMVKTNTKLMGDGAGVMGIVPKLESVLFSKDSENSVISEYINATTNKKFILK